MFSPRTLLAALLCALISSPTALAMPAPELALGVLTRASDAHLNALPAFVGLSVIEDENISTEVEGKLGVRIGSVMLALSGNSSATLHRISGGTHVDLESGWLYFSSPANSCEAALHLPCHQPRSRFCCSRSCEWTRSLGHPRSHRIQQRPGKPGQAVRNQLGSADPKFG
jgi:hypothetical protein